MTPTLPKVSIIIRARNEEFWLGQALAQVNTQTYRDFETILVDSGSTDNTIAIFSHYRPDDPILQLKTFRPGDAINKGIEAGKGQLAVILSAHCIPATESWLEHLVETMDDERVGAAYGRQLPLPSSHPFDKRDLLNTFGIEPRLQKLDTFFHNANSIIRRSLWQTIPFDGETPHIEDRLWAAQVIEHGAYIAYSPEAAVYHHHGINHHSDMNRAEAISDILVDKTMINGNDYPPFLAPEHEPVLFCLLGHSQKHHEPYVTATTELARSFPKARICISSEHPKSLENPDLTIFPRKASENHLTFVDILGKMLDRSGTKDFFPNCVVYLNPKSPEFDISRIRELTRLYYKGMYDSVFFARPEFNNLWAKNGDIYQQIGPDYSPRASKTPVYVALYGLGLATSPQFIRNGELVGSKVGIISREDSQ
ncbi:glycosyltransferase family 2 protein [Desulfovibrio ferrophilus]|uniref:Glycosyltransferase, group 2 family n=1 Tax=Desulfovibrio ferrophilus TaxID=241368 RepID=A0A2Z6B278_9BACT|nr:glycosyltransferase family A protein [Desulfovibrio ferrophilus]BBD09581.1 glycosyltransferase, group 2 family [Desulfovibrio ferrophilus]